MKKPKRLSKEQLKHLDNLFDGIYDLIEKKVEFYQPVNHKDPNTKCKVCGMNKDSPIVSMCLNDFCPYGDNYENPVDTYLMD